MSVLPFKVIECSDSQACSLILKTKNGDNVHSELSRAKRAYRRTQDGKQAFNMLHEKRHRSIEAKLLEGLAKTHSNDYVTALESIPRNMRLLYIHSFQSLVWNNMASLRFKRFGHKPAVGDLVLLKNDDPDETFCDEEVTENAEGKKDEKKMVKVLQEEDLNQYTIHDIVLPLPGYDIVYPENMKEAYKEALEAHGLTLEMPKQKVRTYSLSGTYRKLFGEVKDLSWKIMHYNEEDYTLIRSDLEEYCKKAEPKSIEGGKFKALILIFSLNPSNYATMVLRELLKCDTSTSYQAKLNHNPSTKQQTANTEEPTTNIQPNSETGLQTNADCTARLQESKHVPKNEVGNKSENFKKPLELENGRPDNIAGKSEIFKKPLEVANVPKDEMVCSKPEQFKRPLELESVSEDDSTKKCPKLEEGDSVHKNNKSSSLEADDARMERVMEVDSVENNGKEETGSSTQDQGNDCNTVADTKEEG